MYPSHLQFPRLTFLLPRPLTASDVRAARESRSAADGLPQSEVDGEDHNDQYIHLQRSNLQRATHPHRRASMRVIIDWRTRARRISIPSGRK